ncbi:MAG: DUF2914 domain-containing protein [Elusimicrobiales bacterium]
MRKYAIVAIPVFAFAGAALAQNAAPAKAEPAKAEAAADAAKPAQPASALKAEKLVIASAVENREPVGETADFPAGTEKAFCWMKVSGAAEGTVTHVWYLEGKKVAEVPLQIKYDPMRTWSSKTVSPGSWKVEAVDGSGAQVAAAEFTVQK